MRFLILTLSFLFNVDTEQAEIACIFELASADEVGGHKCVLNKLACVFIHS
jgi:hypothetical protein